MRLAPITLLLLAIITLVTATPVDPASRDDDDTLTLTDHCQAFDDREAEIKELQATTGGHNNPSVDARIKALEIERDHHAKAIGKSAKAKAERTIPDPFRILEHPQSASLEEKMRHHVRAIDWHNIRAERRRNDAEKDKPNLNSPLEGERRMARHLVALATAEADKHGDHAVSHTEKLAELNSAHSPSSSFPHSFSLPLHPAPRPNNLPQSSSSSAQPGGVQHQPPSPIGQRPLSPNAASQKRPLGGGGGFQSGETQPGSSFGDAPEQGRRKRRRLS